MFSEELKKARQRPIEPHLLNQKSKAVKNFFCKYLYDDDILISYAPTSEFGATQSWRWLTGGRLCRYKREGNTIEPFDRFHFKAIQELINAGIIKVKHNIQSPHQRCVIFEWSTGIKKHRRHILIRNCFHSGSAKRGMMASTQATVTAIGAIYGLQVKYTSGKGLFELLKGNNGEPIKYGESKRTYIFMNKKGEPVTRWSDMSLAEWEESLHAHAERCGSVKSQLKLPEGKISHLEQFVR